MKTLLLKLCAAALVATLAVAATAHAAGLRVMNSDGFTAAYKVLEPKFIAQTGNSLNTALGPSTSRPPEAIPNRFACGEPADTVIMVGYALDGLIKQGKVIPESRVELTDSRVGMVVREGVAKPDISSPEALEHVPLHVRSIAYSDNASGVYIRRELFEKLGIEEQVKAKAKMIPRISVASVVATGGHEVNFQQVSELLPIPGATFVGKIPESLQSVTRYVAGTPVGTQYPRKAKALLDYLVSPTVQTDVKSTKLDSVPDQ